MLLWRCPETWELAAFFIDVEAAVHDRSLLYTAPPQKKNTTKTKYGRALIVHRKTMQGSRRESFAARRPGFADIRCSSSATYTFRSIKDLTRQLGTIAPIVLSVQEKMSQDQPERCRR